MNGRKQNRKTEPDRAAIASAVAFIGDWLDYWMARSGLPGLSVAIRHDGDLVLNRAWGYVDLDSQEKLTPQHVFRVASHTKMFTAVAIALLQGRGLLAFDDPVEKHLPWMKKTHGLGSITLRQLLSHKSGLPRDTSGTDYWDLKHAYVDADELKRQVLKMDKVRHKPVFKYSNVGFCLLGQVIEQVTGQRYIDFITDEIIKPLHLPNTYAEFDRVPERRLVTGYTPPTDGRREMYDPRVLQKSWEAANSVCSTPADMSDFADRKDRELLGKKNGSVLTRQWARAFPPYSYGLGHERVNIDGTVFTGHTGGFPGQSTYTLHSDDLKLSVSVFTTAENDDIHNLMNGIVRCLMFYLDNPHAANRGRFANPNEAYEAVTNRRSLNLFDLTEADPFADYFSFPQAGRDIYAIKNVGGFNFEDQKVAFTRHARQPVMTYGTMTYRKS